MLRLLAIILLSVVCLVSCGRIDDEGSISDGGPEKISFNEHIRPILNKNCTGCHGGVTKQGNVSYIIREEALGRGKSGRQNIVPGNAKASELYQRIISKNPALRMPYQRPPLKEEEVQLFERWIEEGAVWEEHWAFVPPVKSDPPMVPNNSWGHSEIDNFVLAKMNENGFEPSPPAPKAKWLRRVSFDLTGLPPSPSEIATFLEDNSPEAYEKQVDRLLGSPHYGERWASLWLDLARYADSGGYEKDRHRDVWPYRDWVISAFNTNMSYRDFVIKQLAGDLLPEASIEDHIATIFSRLTPVNDEGGTDDEEYRTIAVMDRSVTTWSALNGLTMNCVQCHSHPYDPIKFEEYYKSLAFFNTTVDADKSTDAPKMLYADDEVERLRYFEIHQVLKDQIQNMTDITSKVENDLTWSQLPIRNASIDKYAGLSYQRKAQQATWDNYSKEERSQIQYCNKLEEENRSGNKPEWDEYCSSKYQHTKWFYKSLLRTQKRFEAATREEYPTIPLKTVSGEYSDDTPELPVRGEFSFSADLDKGSSEKSISWVRFTVLPDDLQQARHTPNRGFAIDRISAEIHHEDGRKTPITFTGFLPSTSFGVETALEVSTWPTLEGDPIEWQNGLLAHKLFQPVSTIGVLKEPVALQSGDKLMVKLVQIQRSLPIDGLPVYLRSLRIDIADGNDSTSSMISEYVSSFRKFFQDALGFRTEQRSAETISVPVMQEQPKRERRATHVYDRGNYLNKTDLQMPPGTPEVFPPLKTHSSVDETENDFASRLDFAQWFMSDEHPLTARVAVNRLWEQLFGLGIVETLEDFGSIGTLPTHPELLDWLAIYYRDDLKWDTKALLKELVLSSTYRQSSIATADLVVRDPRNQWLARGPRQRLSAEMVRDHALAVSDLLSTKMGGKSVMPPQPDGVWQTINNGHQWVTSDGEDRYRRAIYTYIKRSAPYPSFVAFDDAGHEISAARRLPTNTPLQALVTLNDPVFYEAAVSLGEKMKSAAKENGSFVEGLDEGAMAVLSRTTTLQEQAIFEQTWQKIQADRDGHQADAAAWTSVASALLNMDESLNR